VVATEYSFIWVAQSIDRAMLRLYLTPQPNFTLFGINFLDGPNLTSFPAVLLQRDARPTGCTEMV
jgi:hypothetical protein